MVEVEAEAPVANLSLEVPIGGRDHARVHPHRRRGSQAAKHSFIEKFQNLRLHDRLQLPDLVEKRGAAVGQLEEPGLVSHRRGKGAARMPEQLRLDEIRRDGSAVDLHKRAGGARALTMDGAGEEPLPGTGLAQHQNRGARAGRHATRQVEDLAQRGVRAHEIIQRGEGAGVPFLLSAFAGQ